MPRPIGELSGNGIIAEMRAELRRLWRAVGSNQSPVGEYNEYALASSSDSAHTLTYIPSLSLIPIACLNGLPGRYGIDYTVDFTTGIVTWSATKVAGDILSVFYQTTGDLVALSGVAATGVIADTFDRPNSTTTINPASDGGTWTTDHIGVWGISSNQAYLYTNGGITQRIRRDVGSASMDVSITVKSGTLGTATTVFAYLGYDPAVDRGYIVWLNTWGAISVERWNAGSSTSVGTTTGTSWQATNVATTFECIYNAVAGTVQIKQGGTTLATITDSGGPYATGTWAALALNNTSTSTVVTLDNFSASG